MHTQGLVLLAVWAAQVGAQEAAELMLLPALVTGVGQGVGTGAGAGMGCRRVLLRAAVQRQDAQGRRCSGTVTLTACSGRCDSHEIAEWRFPWKRSRHPVCGFGARALSVVKLPECEEGAGAGARLLQLTRPAACVCRPCRAAATSCGWLPDLRDPPTPEAPEPPVFPPDSLLQL